MGLILLIVLIILLLGAVPAWPHSRQWGYAPSGGLGTLNSAVSAFAFTLHQLFVSKRVAGGANGRVTQPLPPRRNSYGSPSVAPEPTHDSDPAKHCALSEITRDPSSEICGSML